MGYPRTDRIRRRFPFYLAAAAAAGLACAPASQAGSESPGCVAPKGEELQAVRSLVAAFNAHDIHALLLTVHPEVQWFSIAGDAMGIEANSARELGVSLSEYFADCPTCRSKLDMVCATGRRITTYEAASWEREGTPMTQRSIAVYEFDAGKIRRVYYFPADG